MAFELIFDYDDWKNTQDMINSLKTFSDDKFLRTLALSADEKDDTINKLAKPSIIYNWGEQQLKVMIYWN
jgi:hypothetical protein